MATDVICRVVPGGLMASSDAEASKLEPLVGKSVKVRITQPRNLEFHRKFFAMLNAGWSLSEHAHQMNLEQFRAWIIVRAGYCDFVKGGDDRPIVAIPKSISFGSMDNTEFERLYNDVLHTIVHDLFEEKDRDDYRRMIEFASI